VARQFVTVNGDPHPETMKGSSIWVGYCPVNDSDEPCVDRNHREHAKPGGGRIYPLVFLTNRS
jgi:hypothetical protein